ncbi:hypothetical protein ABPG74_003594 [Tetrahymena malaccensis]
MMQRQQRIKLQVQNNLQLNSSNDKEYLNKELQSLLTKLNNYLNMQFDQKFIREILEYIQIVKQNNQKLISNDLVQEEKKTQSIHFTNLILALNFTVISKNIRMICNCNEENTEYCVRCQIFKKKHFQFIYLHRRMAFAYLAIQNKLKFRKEIIQEALEFIFDQKQEIISLQERKKKQYAIKKHKKIY